jgi:hypothetical protein
LQAVELVLLPVVGIHHGYVGVGVDEAGEERGIAEIDYFGARGGGGAGSGRDDLSVGDHDDSRRDQGIALTVEKAGGFQDDGLASGLLPLAQGGKQQDQADEEKNSGLAHELFSLEEHAKTRKADNSSLGEKVKLA